MASNFPAQISSLCRHPGCTLCMQVRSAVTVNGMTVSCHSMLQVPLVRVDRRNETSPVHHTLQVGESLLCTTRSPFAAVLNSIVLECCFQYALRGSGALTRGMQFWLLFSITRFCYGRQHSRLRVCMHDCSHWSPVGACSSTTIWSPLDLRSAMHLLNITYSHDERTPSAPT